jgi:hypothetical protein
MNFPNLLQQCMSGDGSKLEEIDKGTRSRLIECVSNRKEIEAWLATLTIGQRQKLNHPEAVLRRWRKATRVEKPGDAPPKQHSHVEKLKASIIALEEQNTRLAREAPFTPHDKPRDQAAVVWRLLHCSPLAALAVARELSKLARAAETDGART